MWKRIKDFFSFTIWERNAAIALAILSLLVAIVPKVYPLIFPQHFEATKADLNEVQAFVEEYQQKKLLAEIADSVNKQEDSYHPFNPYAGQEINERFVAKVKPQYFDFDPNKIGETEWRRLGLSEKQSAAIERLKAKGFKFRKPEDLAKVYVISPEVYGALFPYVKIAEEVRAERSFAPFPNAVPKEKYVIDINNADSSLWERQRGIGPKLAQRIVNYRTRLGGFISVNQIKEVWNLPDSTFQFLKDKMVVSEVSTNKININTADVQTMGRHPYINFPVARVVEAYRKEHGDFQTIDDIQKLPIVSDSMFQLMRPYITVK